MERTVVFLLAALAGAVVIAYWAFPDILHGAMMGAILGVAVATGVYAFPLDLDYRERRVWPPREP